ncbi:serine/threonine-protein kinase [Roseovarius sp. CAU 1744]|uniref:serine/threonine protein kinase n=1 Tax=Roseovarius sp. CAU 1744 TaxID=3140368 RepID=UPI00325AEBFD
MTMNSQRCDIDLPQGMQLLRGQYTIDCALSHGGFGIAYLARDSLERKVVIKECYPPDFCSRLDSEVLAHSERHEKEFHRILKQFKREAQRLALLDHPGIVRVHQVFEENGTAYMAMDYAEGDDLYFIYDCEPERLTPALLRQMLVEALEAVQYTHEKGILHRDLAPDNLILGDDNHVKLIDFGSAYENSSQQKNKYTKLLAVKDGFSPYEFYIDGDAQDASSDLYSLGATLHYVITGAAPPNSERRLAAIAGGDPDPYVPLASGDWKLDENFLTQIDKALAVNQKDRHRSAEQWLLELKDGAEEAAPAPAPVAAAHPAINQNINDTIAQLVSDTNSRLTQGLPKCLRDDEQDVEKTQEEASKHACPVDIFGNPIKDVEAFLKEQDKNKTTRKREEASAYSTDRENTPLAKSTVRRMLTKFRAGRRGSGSVVAQN